MGKKRRRYQAYRESSSEDELDSRTINTRIVAISVDRRRVLTVSSSPIKMLPRGSIAAGVEQNHGLHAISEGDPDFGFHSDHDLNGTDNVIVRPMAKRYQASVSHQS